MADSLILFIKYTLSDPETYLHVASGTLFVYDEYLPIDPTQRLYFTDQEALDRVDSGVLLVSLDGITALPAADGIAELTFSKKDNFSYSKIGLGKKILIPEPQQMVVFQGLLMDDDGELLVDGELVMIE